MNLYEAGEVSLWANPVTHECFISVGAWPSRWPDYRDRPPWIDPIGCAYLQWKEMTDVQRVQLMTETALDLAMQGYDLGAVLREMAQVRQFRALGSESIPMCRALTKAIVGKCLEPNTMSFEELIASEQR
jgi:hypothetical protein